MELMYSSGLRLAELVGLNLADVKLDERQLRVIGKGSRERCCPSGGWRWSGCTSGSRYAPAGR